MNAKRWRQHLRLFFLDHLWVIVLFLAAPVAFLVFYVAVVQPDSGGTGLYYCFLSLFVLLCFLLYRLYATWNLYELFCSEPERLEDFLLYAPKSREEQHYQKMLSAMYRKHLAERSQLEEERKQNKLMIYRWVHQLKTPLSVIQLIAENNDYQADYKRVSRSALQIQYDLDQILNLYKLDAIKNDFHVEQVALRQVAKDSVNALKASFIEAGIYPKLNVADSLVVYSDYKWLRFVLEQLLTNALKYSEAGKSIVIEASAGQDGVVLSVVDAGCGIQKEDLPRIFELFFTGQNGRLRRESTGLGLYMVKQILDYLGHSITVESDAGKGSRFSIKFV